MKAMDLLTTDIGKWVAIRFEIIDVNEGKGVTASLQARPEGTSFLNHLNRYTILEFTDSPALVQEVGDVFRMLEGAIQEYTLAAIVNDVCLLIGPVKDGRTRGFSSARYPLDPELWTLIRKGT